MLSPSVVTGSDHDTDPTTEHARSLSARSKLQLPNSHRIGRPEPPAGSNIRTKLAIGDIDTWRDAPHTFAGGRTLGSIASYSRYANNMYVRAASVARDVDLTQVSM